MKPHFVKIYLGEIIMQADIIVPIVHNINVAVTQGHTVQAFGLLHYLLIHASIVSRMLWPQREASAKVERRARELRETLGVDDVHPLVQRHLRNHLEHYDERLDSWVEESERHNFVDRWIGPRAGVQGVDDKDIFRLYDPVENLFIFRGESFGIQGLVDALDDIRERAVKAQCRLYENDADRTQNPSRFHEVTRGEPMKYTQKSVTTGSASLISPAVSEAVVGTFPTVQAFLPWQPSTWPSAPTKVDAGFIANLRKIFDESVLGEIRNVIQDIKKSNGDLQHRGHVVAIALMCALDAISSYGYRQHNVSKFVKAHFPGEYKLYADDLYKLYRNSMIHSWNLFEAAILPANEKITKTKGTLSFGLLNFFGALEIGVEDFLKKMETDPHLQTNALNRYKALKKTARP